MFGAFNEREAKMKWEDTDNLMIDECDCPRRFQYSSFSPKNQRMKRKICGSLVNTKRTRRDKNNQPLLQRMSYLRF